MKRRRLLRLVALGAVGASGVVSGWALSTAPSQPEKKAHLVVFLFTDLTQAGPQTSIASFKKAMTELGYLEGQHIRYDYRDAAGAPRRFPELAREVVELAPDLIVCQNPQAAAELMKATKTIPIAIASTSSNVVEAGLVKDLARPGGNLTGVTAIGPSIASKRLQLLKETAPAIKRIAVLQDAGEPGRDLVDMQKTALELGVEIVPIYLQSQRDVDAALASAAEARADALIMGSTLNFLGGTSVTVPIAEFALERRWPTTGPGVPVGLLLQYDVQVIDAFARLARGYADKILKGVKAGDLPFESATTTRLALNLCTASKIGLTVPQSVLTQVTEAYPCSP